MADVTPTPANGAERLAGSYEAILLSDQELSPYMIDMEQSGLSGRVLALLDQQRETWPQLQAGYEQLISLETKTLDIGGSHVEVQFNPKRIRNTAKFDKTAVAERPCFLDAANLPPEERGLAYEDLIIVGNPFPIVPDHLTIIGCEHTPQGLDKMLQPGLALARDLGDDFFVFYNGPEAGASAPDHAHLQAGSSTVLPIERDLDLVDPRLFQSVVAEDDMQIYLPVPDKLQRTVIVLEATDQSRLAAGVEQIITELPRTGEGTEPLVNVIFTYDSVAAGWKVYLFPRRQFRPQRFFADDDSQLLISPASLEMAGMMVVPREEDFVKLSAADIKQIYADVSFEPAAIRPILESI